VRWKLSCIPLESGRIDLLTHAFARWTLFSSGRRAEGIAALKNLEQAAPNFVGTHMVLARAYLVESFDQEFLREAATSARLRARTRTIAQIDAAGRRLSEGGSHGHVGTSEFGRRGGLASG
jgi:hypothetical protein